MAAKTQAAELSWEGVDRGLFDHLRDWRRRIAIERGVPAYVVLHDATLMDLARVRPTELGVLQSIHGFGVTRLREFGRRRAGNDRGVLPRAWIDDEYRTGRFANRIGANCSIRQAEAEDDGDEASGVQSLPPGPHDRRSDELHRRARATVVEYLAEYIAEFRPARIDMWVDPATYRRVASIAVGAESARLKPLHDQLGGTVSYDDIRLVMAHLQSAG